MKSAALAAAKETEMRISGCFFDGIAKESALIFDQIPAFIRSDEHGRLKLPMFGKDAPHQCKSGRNRVAYGSTGPTGCGDVLASLTNFSYTEKPTASIQLRDQFSDFRVRQLFEALSEFVQVYDDFEQVL